jgi:hypothetical protein
MLILPDGMPRHSCSASTLEEGPSDAVEVETATVEWLLHGLKHGMTTIDYIKTAKMDYTSIVAGTWAWNQIVVSRLPEDYS